MSHKHDNNHHCGYNHNHHHHHHHNTSTKSIMIAFILNLFFSVFEVVGGIVTGSVAIISDAIHDFGDAISIGIALYLEKKSKRKPNKQFTFGYGRYSILGALITSIILIIGSVIVITNAIYKIITPEAINYNGMIIFAIIGTVVNFIAVKVTSGGESLNQKTVNLHMLEDVLGWLIVLVGAIVMKFTNFSYIDPILSIGVAIFILHHAIISSVKTINIFLEKTPNEINIDEIKESILKEKDIENIHDLHIWSIDGVKHYATVHIVTDNPTQKLKENIREIFEQYKIVHSTIQIEKCGESCLEQEHHSHIHTIGGEYL